MRISICDDEQVFLDETHTLLLKCASLNNLSIDVNIFSNGDDLLTYHKNNYSDLIILDVIMPFFNGIDTAKELRVSNPQIPIIFLTSTRDFAVESYDVEAYHYLLKPVNENKFFSVLDSFLSVFTKPANTFMAHTAEGFCKINIEDVSYLEAQNKQVIVYLFNGTSISIRELFSRCEEVFSPDKGFFKCHRSYIVNLSCIEQFTKTQVCLFNHVNIPISRNRYIAFKETYFNHMFN